MTATGAPSIRPLRRIIAGFLLPAAVALAQPAGAADMALRVLLNNAPPYRIVRTSREGPRYSGIYVDVMRAVAARTGLALHFTEVPYARAFAMMQNGEGDVLLGPNRTAEREVYLHYLEPALPAEPKVFVTRAAAAPAIAGQDDLHGLRIATLRGAHHSDRFDNDAALAVIPVTDYDTALRMLDAGRVDTVIMPELRARWLLRGRAGFGFASYRLSGEPSYIVLARASPQVALAGRLAAALRRLQAEGEIARILDLYG